MSDAVNRNKTNIALTIVYARPVVHFTDPCSTSSHMMIFTWDSSLCINRICVERSHNYCNRACGGFNPTFWIRSEIEINHITTSPIHIFRSSTHSVCPRYVCKGKSKCPSSADYCGSNSFGMNHYVSAHKLTTCRMTVQINLVIKRCKIVPIAIYNFVKKGICSNISTEQSSVSATRPFISPKVGIIERRGNQQKVSVICHSCPPLNKGVRCL